MTSFVSRHRASSASSDLPNGKPGKCDTNGSKVQFQNGSTESFESKNGFVNIKGGSSDKVAPETHPLVVMNLSSPIKEHPDSEDDLMCPNSASNSITTDDIMNLDLV